MGNMEAPTTPGLDWKLITELADAYDAAGMGDTSGGRFLRSLASTQVPPRGRGQVWLEDLIRKGPPSVDTLALVSELAALSEHAGPGLETLTRLIARIKSGHHRFDQWEIDFVADLKTRALQGPKVLTPEERLLITASYLTVLSGSSFYWNSRPAQVVKIGRIYELMEKGDVREADLAWVREKFKSTAKVVEDPPFKPGDLCSARTATGWHPGLVTGPWRVASNPVPGAPKMGFPVLVDGREQLLPPVALRKRLKRGSS
jgi:hypothetical protein